MTRTTGLLALLSGICVAQAQEQEVFYPHQIASCLERPTAQGLEARLDRNPYYLRGDFDGDGEADHAVAVRGKKTRRNGVLICTAKGVYVVGADRVVTPPFSNMPDDNFVAPQWATYSRKETQNLGKFSSNVPRPVPVTKGDSIAMIWEDGICLIYWDGRQFKWAGSKE